MHKPELSCVVTIIIIPYCIVCLYMCVYWLNLILAQLQTLYVCIKLCISLGYFSSCPFTLWQLMRAWNNNLELIWPGPLRLGYIHRATSRDRQVPCHYIIVGFGLVTLDQEPKFFTMRQPVIPISLDDHLLFTHNYYLWEVQVK